MYVCLSYSLNKDFKLQMEAYTSTLGLLTHSLILVAQRGQEVFHYSQFF